MTEVLELEIRRKIHKIITKNPGIHASKIAEIVSLSGQTTDYHLLYMERNEIINSTKQEGYRRYYAKGKLGFKDRRQIAILRHETPLKIVLILINQFAFLMPYFHLPIV